MLPFEMLVLNDQGAVKTDKDLPYIAGAEFFGDRNLISYCQSVTALALSRIHAKGKGHKDPVCLRLADPIFQEKDDRAMVGPKTKAPTGALASLFKGLNMMSAENGGQTGGLRFLTAPPHRGPLQRISRNCDKKGSSVYTGFAASKC